MGKHWLDGLWFFEDFKFVVYEVKGETSNWRNLGYFDYPDLNVDCITGTWKYGEFGETSAEVKEATGADTYNVDMNMWEGKFIRKGVVSEDGKTITSPNIMGGGAVIGKWIDEDGLKALQDDREDTHNMTCPYPKQPEKQGKLLWLSGPPGAGKSTTAQLLAKENGYVYFEADCFMNLLNPYIPLDAPEPSMAQMDQKCVTGFTKETLRTIFQGMDEFPKLMELKEYDMDLMKAWYSEMAKDILKEKNKIGGSWAVAQAVPSREFRDCIRKVLGDQCIFVILKLSEETNGKRLADRHAEMDQETKDGVLALMQKMYKLYEPTGEDEDNSVDVEIGPEMDRDAVAKAVLEKVSKYL